MRKINPQFAIILSSISWDVETAVSADLEFKQDMKPGWYAVAIGATDNQGLRYSVIVSANVGMSAAGLSSSALAMLAVSLAILGASAIIVRKRRSTGLHSIAGSLVRVLEEQKLAMLIVGLAATNLAAPAAGGMHLILGGAASRTVPLSNATLAAYGRYVFWLDVLALVLGIWTVTSFVLVWKPNRRVAMVILLVAVMIGPVLVVGGSIPFSAPQAKCNVLIKNAPFSGGYSPATLTIQVGSSVTWCNDNYSIHADTVTSDVGLFNSGLIPQGASWTYTFPEPGEYD